MLHTIAAWIVLAKQFSAAFVACSCLSVYVVHHLEKTLTVASFSCQAILWTVVIYFMTGLSIKDGSWHFWVFYVIMSLTALHGASLVRFMAYFAPDRDAANALIGNYSFT